MRFSNFYGFCVVDELEAELAVVRGLEVFESAAVDFSSDLRFAVEGSWYLWTTVEESWDFGTANVKDKVLGRTVDDPWDVLEPGVEDSGDLWTAVDNPSVLGMAVDFPTDFGIALDNGELVVDWDLKRSRTILLER